MFDTVIDTLMSELRKQPFSPNKTYYNLLAGAYVLGVPIGPAKSKWSLDMQVLNFKILLTCVSNQDAS